MISFKEMPLNLTDVNGDEYLCFYGDIQWFKTADSRDKENIIEFLAYFKDKRHPVIISEHENIKDASEAVQEFKRDLAKTMSAWREASV